MGISDLTPQNTIADPVTGKEANVGTKSTGEDAVHVISEIGSVGSFDGTKYTVDSDNTDITLSGSGNGTQIFEYIGSGLMESFMLDVEDKNTDILFYIDGVLRYDISCMLFENMGFSFVEAGEYPTSYHKGQKIFKQYNRIPIKFTTSFEIRARSGGKKIKGYVVNYFGN